MTLAMIAAAGADGVISGDELTRLMSAIDRAPIPAKLRAQLTSALNDPPTVEDIAALSAGPEEASELYGAAVSAIDVDTPAERLFLQRFARALRLDAGLVEAIHRAVSDGSAETPPAPPAGP
jgi:uncharacterized membrane protein YebE (DUF533 family)